MHQNRNTDPRVAAALNRNYIPQDSALHQLINTKEIRERISDLNSRESRNRNLKLVFAEMSGVNIKELGIQIKPSELSTYVSDTYKLVNEYQVPFNDQKGPYTLVFAEQGKAYQLKIETEQPFVELVESVVPALAKAKAHADWMYRHQELGEALELRR